VSLILVIKSHCSKSRIWSSCFANPEDLGSAVLQNHHKNTAPLC